MSARRDRYKRLEQLYVVGKEVAFTDGTLIWVQVMNPLQSNEARTDAETARARMSIALAEIGSDEQTRALGAFTEMATEDAIAALLSHKWQDWFHKANTRLRDDPEWAERALVMERTNPQEMDRRPADDIQRQVYNKITQDFLAEVNDAVDLEREFESGRLHATSEADLREEYLELYRAQRSAAAASLEYLSSEAWYAARVCDGVQAEPGVWDHGACVHEEQVWESKADFQGAPEALQQAIRAALDDLAMTVREAKNSDSTTSSSASSVLQNVPEASTPSTQEGTHSSALGTSTSLSSMHSTS